MTITILLKVFLRATLISKFYPLQKTIHWSIHSDTSIYRWIYTHFAVSIRVLKYYALRYTVTSQYRPILMHASTSVYVTSRRTTCVHKHNMHTYGWDEISSIHIQFHWDFLLTQRKSQEWKLFVLNTSFWCHSASHLTVSCISCIPIMCQQA